MSNQDASDSVGSPSVKKKKKYTLLVSDVDNRGGSACVGTEGTWEISASSPQFCGKPENALKKTKVLYMDVKNPTCKYQAEGVKPKSFTRKLEGKDRKRGD